MRSARALMSTTGNRKLGAQKRYSAAGSTRPRSTGTTRQAAPLTGGITRPSRSRCLIRDGGFDGTLIDALMAMPPRYTEPVERRIGPSSNDRVRAPGGASDCRFQRHLDRGGEDLQGRVDGLLGRELRLDLTHEQRRGQGLGLVVELRLHFGIVDLSSQPGVGDRRQRAFFILEGLRDTRLNPLPLAGQDAGRGG